MSRPIRTTVSKQNLVIMGVPKKFHDLCIEDFYTYDSESLEEVKNFLVNYVFELPENFENNQGLCLYGANGTGKTFIACMIVKEAYRRRYTAKRVTFVEYVSEYTRVWNSRSTEEREALEDSLYNNYKAVEFLVLEEVGKEVDSKISAPILEDLLRYREDHGLVTIMCTNLKPSMIEEKYGKSIASLMQGNMTPIKMEGSDKRKEYFKERIDEE